MLRQTESAKRARAMQGLTKTEMHPAMKTFQHQAKMRDTTFVYWPHGLSKRKSNSTLFARKRKCIFWRIEWIFEGIDVRVVNARADENSTLKSLVAKHLRIRADNAPMITELRHFCRPEISELKLYFQKESCEAYSLNGTLKFNASAMQVVLINQCAVLQGNKKVFYELDREDTIGSQLPYKTVYEFPVINVAISADPMKFPIVFSKPPPAVIPAASPVLDVNPFNEVLEGRFFPEEDIEEGEFVP